MKTNLCSRSIDDGLVLWLQPAYREFLLAVRFRTLICRKRTAWAFSSLPTLTAFFHKFNQLQQHAALA
jgi:hypothetical protein